MTNIVFSTGLVLGSLCILAVLYNFVFRGRFEVKDISIIVFGVLLTGLSIFTLVKLVISPDGKFEASFESSIGAAKADTNAAIERLTKKIATIDQSIDALTKSTPSAASEITEIRASDKPNQEFLENGGFTVIVFFKDAQQGLATKIVDKILKLGFKSSSVKSDLTEAKTQYPAGTAWIVWEPSAVDVKDKLSTTIKQISPSTSVKIRTDPSDLLRADVQILLF